MKEGERIWSDLNASNLFIFRTTTEIIGEAHQLFGDAVKAFDGGSYSGAVLLCRATLETAFYQFLTRRWEKMELIVDIPVALGGEIRSVEFAELAKAIKKKVRFSKEQLIAIKRVQGDGNFVAHLANRQEIEIRRLFRAMEPLYVALSQKKAAGEEYLRVFGELGKRFRLGITPARALADLRDTASIIETMAHAISGRRF